MEKSEEMEKSPFALATCGQVGQIDETGQIGEIDLINHVPECKYKRRFVYSQLPVLLGFSP